ncbi:MAG TPA: CDP-alcohol phosphatidyltransferase family protein [Pseudonocardiaceae bacterium]|nr:CDP-alcohol phosphatidyltransferase family protein [Pseudonocardiaceae bacterium]
MFGPAQTPLGPGLPGGPPCGHRGCTAQLGEQWGTAPNAVTAARTVATVALWGVAVTTGGAGWLLAALVCYWVGDIADGLLARLTHRETRTGAVLDVLADRVSVCLVVVSYVTTHPAAVAPAAVFLPQFVVLDAYLTLAFPRWSLLSPNYFALVDATVYRLNWSPPAKVSNTAAVVLVVLLTGSMVVATALAVAVLAVKVYSAARLARLPVPRTRSGCAVLDRNTAG